MKPRRVGWVTLAAIFGVMLALTVTGSALHAQESGSTRDIAAYLNNILDPAPSSQQIREELTSMIRAECAALMRGSPDELKQEEEWLKGLLSKAEDLVKDASERMRNATALSNSGEGWYSLGDAEREAAQIRLENARLDMAVVALINAEVGKCIEIRKPALQGVRWISGSWKVDCNKVEGITPDTAGRIDLQLQPDNSMTGTVYPTAARAGVEVAGALTVTGYFNLLPTEDRRSIMVEVDGNIDGFNPLSASGSIRITGVFEGNGTSRCNGSWKGH